MRSARSGMSLIEVTITMTLLVMGLSTVFDCMGGANSARKRAENRNLALAAVQTQVEVFQAKDLVAFNSTIAVAGSTILYAVPGLALQSGDTQAGRIETVSTATVNGSQRTCLRFTVRWKDLNGPDQVVVHYHYVPRS